MRQGVSGTLGEVVDECNDVGEVEIDDACNDVSPKIYCIEVLVVDLFADPEERGRGRHQLARVLRIEVSLEVTVSDLAVDLVAKLTREFQEWKGLCYCSVIDVASAVRGGSHQRGGGSRVAFVRARGCINAVATMIGRHRSLSDVSLAFCGRTCCHVEFGVCHIAAGVLVNPNTYTCVGF